MDTLHLALVNGTANIFNVMMPMLMIPQKFENELDLT